MAEAPDSPEDSSLMEELEGSAALCLAVPEAAEPELLTALEEEADAEAVLLLPETALLKGGKEMVSSM